MKTNLVIFGTDGYEMSIKSLKKTADNFFTNIQVFNKNDIDPLFYEKNKSILDLPRGAGYWLWKPYFIDKILSSSDENDIVFYVDAGNIFISDPTPLYSLFDKNDGVVLFDNRDGMLNGNAAQNFISCKKDCFVLMNCDTEEYINGIHLNASYQIYKNNEFSRKFVKEYLDICQIEDIITDTPNKYGDNYPGYHDHRHDQSILSILAIKYKIKPDIDPSEWGNRTPNRLYQQIFHHHRNPKFNI
jgi:hypothetical protein